MQTSACGLGGARWAIGWRSWPWLGLEQDGVDGRVQGRDPGVGKGVRPLLVLSVTKLRVVVAFSYRMGL